MKMTKLLCSFKFDMILIKFYCNGQICSTLVLCFAFHM